MAIIDIAQVAELAAVTSAATQILKYRPFLRRFDGEFLAGIVGTGVGLLWYAASGSLVDPASLLGVNWAEVFRGSVNGLLSGVGASAIYNGAKASGIPNILPTRSEKDIGEILGVSPPITQPILSAQEAGVRVESKTAKEIVTAPTEGNVG